jgi:large conductance mechanosensitive channel
MTTRPEATGALGSVGAMLKEFRQFLLRGSLVDLAIAVVIGVAFGAVVTALVKDLVTPLIAAIGGQPDFGGLVFTVNHSRFRYGDFLNAVLSFVIVAAVMFFLVVRPVNALLERRRTEPPIEADTRDCPACLSQIPLAARRCAFCTEEVGPAAAAAAP